ncbi:glycosyl transferase, family 2 [Magnetococcus marinus MC-1]|uniref:Glycosyl transferase, family 2 n=1 Tax=Magnetococcus marinus (strain ATCC BAA-1437 / JCM 17883 / MC-1) TaxID=156889 RepID=A0LCR5_MAGMM|nr:glycosyltransferase family 2 protein [Magnetococcus marinus]ABK45758.1 glycosyl transferase, family 2 [Magnetococcus marinus MC-1]
MKVIIIVPAYNEEEMIGRTVEALCQLKPAYAAEGMTLSVYVVDDGSTDATRSKAEQAGADRVVRHRVNQGLGAAVRSGLTAAHGDQADITVKFDADLQHDPQDVMTLIQPIREDTADVVYGNRFERISYRMPFIRRMGNKVFTGLMRWLTKWPLKDSQPGIFAVSQVYTRQFYLPGDYNYTQQILVDAYRKGMRFEHVSVAFHKRVTGKSFVSLRYPFKVLPQIFLVLISVRPLKIFAPLGLGCFFLGGGVAMAELVHWLFGAGIKPVVHVNLVLALCTFGLQTLFFGILAHLIVDFKGRH